MIDLRGSVIRLYPRTKDKLFFLLLLLFYNGLSLGMQGYIYI